MQEEYRNLDAIDLSEEENFIDIKGYLKKLFHFSPIIIGVALLVGILAYVWAKFFITPQYEAKSMVYISNNSEKPSVSLSDLQIGSQLAVDYQIVAKTEEVADEVIQKLNLEMSYESLLRKIKISNPEDSHILTIAVRDVDPEMATIICNTYVEVLCNRTASIMSTDKPAMVHKSSVPDKIAYPSGKKFAVVGCVLAAFLVILVITVRFILDDTVKDEEDIRKYLGISTLASIPVEQGNAPETSKSRRND